MTTIRPTDIGINDSTINKVAIQSISWSKFKGEIPQNPPYYAHIFWNIDYRYYFNHPNSYKPTVIAKPFISKRSWARIQLTNDKLLRHEYGHYLIGCLCALKFQQTVNQQQNINFATKQQAIKFCQLKFKQTLAEYLQLQKKYDDETDHYYNQDLQQKWDKYLVCEINKMDKPILVQQNKSTDVMDKKTASSLQRSEKSQDSTRSSFGRIRNNYSSQSLRRLAPHSCSVINVQKPKMKLPPLPIRKIVSYNSN